MCNSWPLFNVAHFNDLNEGVLQVAQNKRNHLFLEVFVFDDLVSVHQQFLEQTSNKIIRIFVIQPDIPATKQLCPLHPVCITKVHTNLNGQLTLKFDAFPVHSRQITLHV